MKKYFFITILLILIVPSVALASWWNPLSWFNGWTFTKEAPPVVVQIEQPPPVYVEEPTSLPNPNIEVKKEVKKEIPKPPQSTLVTPTFVPTPAPIVVAPAGLSISNISVDEESNSVRVSWKTNIVSESKVILEGKSYISKRGVGTEHYVDIEDLESDLLYGGTITAIANNAWKSQNFQFTTKPTPLKITLVSNIQGCSPDRCIISWKTNYRSDGKIKISKALTGEVVKYIPSLAEDSREHSTHFKLEPKTKYIYKIYATTDSETENITGEFETSTQPVPCGSFLCPQA